MEESIKIAGIIGKYLLENIDKNGELPVFIIGIALLYAINAYIKVAEDEGYGPKVQKEDKKKKKCEKRR